MAKRSSAIGIALERREREGKTMAVFPPLIGDGDQRNGMTKEYLGRVHNHTHTLTHIIGAKYHHHRKARSTDAVIEVCYR